jgi:type IV pilus assembly protein PilA
MFKAVKKKLKDQRGLTLIELLAVVVILGIIAAIAVPSIGNLINNTRDDAVVAEGIQIISAAKLYRASNPADNAITHTDLATYIENVDDAEFTVNVTGTNGALVYTLTGHPSAPLAVTGRTEALGVTETELLAH